MDRRNPEQGSVLLVVMIMLVLIAGLVAAAVARSVADSKAVFENENYWSAFYLAEAGLNVSQWEIGEGIDPDKDGVGNVAASAKTGEYDVIATEVLTNVWLIKSSGRFAGNTVTLQEKIRVETAPAVPDGAIATIGDTDELEMLYSGDTDLILDGGDDSPAMAIADGDFYDEMVDQLDHGDVDPDKLTGLGKTGLDSIIFTTDAKASFETFYDDLHGDISDKIDTLGKKRDVSDKSNVKIGKIDAPVEKQYKKDQLFKDGQTVTAYGTGIFHNKFVIEKGADVTWNGDLIVFSDDSTDANLEVDGDLVVNGNLIVISGDGRNSKFLVKSEGEVVVNGALTCLTDYQTYDTKLEFYVENKLTVNGLLTVVASTHQFELKKPSTTYVEGMMQIGMPHGTNGKKTTLKIEDDLEVVRDVDKLKAAMDILEAIGGDLKVGSGGGTLSVVSLDDFGWERVYDDVPRSTKTGGVSEPKGGIVGVK